VEKVNLLHAAWRQLPKKLTASIFFKIAIFSGIVRLAIVLFSLIYPVLLFKQIHPEGFFENFFYYFVTTLI